MNDIPDPEVPEVPERARRRTYASKYKHDVLAEDGACDHVGKGALLRREGLYSLLIGSWRDQGEVGALQALGTPPDHRCVRFSTRGASYPGRP